MADILNCTETEYHADPYPVSLSQSTAKQLIEHSPLHAWWYHPRLGGHRMEQTSAMAYGDSLDRLLFGGTERLAVLPFGDYRTKAAQVARDEAISNGLTPVLERVHQEHKILALLVRETVLHVLGYDLTTCGHQVAVAWDSPIRCRTKLDAWTPDLLWILDLKTSSNADPDWLHRHCVDQGWDIQAAAELEAVTALHPDLCGRVRFADVVVEDGSAHDKPSCVTVYEIAGSMLELGQSRWRRAKALWAECLERGDWPAYSTTIVQAVAPAYEMAKEKAHEW